jgi:ubiquinone/menaquinone biosynthesis C-methylase UbiE
VHVTDKQIKGDTMKRKGIHKPTIEDLVELSGIETLHPGGFALTKRTAEITGMKSNMKVLDVSSGRGTQSIYYAKEFGVDVIGVDISPNMVITATACAIKNNVSRQVTFKQGDSQSLPFDANTFDVVINECAVGIPDDSQKVLNEMVRVAKPGGSIAIHESIWKKAISSDEKTDIAECYGTTPLEHNEWMNMLKSAGVKNIVTEFEEWSKPEMFWKVRKDKDVPHYSKVMSLAEKTLTVIKIMRTYGIKGVIKAFQNEKYFYSAVIDGKLGYCLFKGIK